jgi:hypothetical protein
MAKVLDLDDILSRDTLATQIADTYERWKTARRPWMKDRRDVRDYLYATDTRTTENQTLPWKNSTTRPKLTQISDNLHANYMAALFPAEQWFRWKGEDEESKGKADIIEKYMMNKLRQSKFQKTMSSLVMDFIREGNAFGDVEFVSEIFETEEGEQVKGYVGPRLKRVSLSNHVFDPTAAHYEDAPKITRYVKTMGQLVKELHDRPELQYNSEIIEKAKNARKRAIEIPDDEEINHAYQVDGFGSLNMYLKSNLVEILEFEGDLYDSHNGILYKNSIITVIDRAFVVRIVKMPSWLGKSYKQHVGWRLRPDNLLAMGPLDNLAGLQYRMDHLENLRADIFDRIAHPQYKVQGDVEDFTDAPGERIYIGEEGDVDYLTPPPQSLQADLQIQEIEQTMELMVGAPKDAMGIRTPGEKTATEVNQLQTAASRIFQNKVNYFEQNFVEPLLNGMLEQARRNMESSEVIEVVTDSDLNVSEFVTVTKDDITAQGKLYPIGGRHFEEQQRLLGNLQIYLQFKADPTVGVHLSGKQMAKTIAELFGDDEMFKDNVTVIEQMETQKLLNAAQESAAVDQITPTGEEDENIVDQAP